MFSLEQLKGIADARVQALVEGGTLDNAKPIYYHPIYFADQNWNAIMCVTILDNNPTAYTKSTFIAKVEELCDAGALIQVLQGGIRKQNTDNYDMPLLIEKNAGSPSGYRFFVITSNDFDLTYDFEAVMDEVSTNFVDGVNKIN